MKAIEIVQSYFEALGKGEVEKALSYFTANTKWSQPGNNKFSGLKNNPDEIAAMIDGMLQDTTRTRLLNQPGQC